MKGALDSAAPGLGATFHATQALLKAIADGESADVVILTDEGIAQLAAQGKLAGTAQPVGRSGVGIAVRAGAAKPDISSVDAMKRSLLNAESVAHSRMGASGLYFASLLERLGLADKLKKRVIVEKGPVGAAVARGEAQIGAQLLCELAPVEGIDIVGPLPREVQNYNAFSAAMMKDSPQARAFMEFLRSDAVRAAMKKNLFEA
ncbi:MAG TPA: substrate-binding domain-containing protein [Burkholderiales bacterium]|nr:substrate-binding domain-containing protein [Burkholderiales bacterium]